MRTLKTNTKMISTAQIQEPIKRLRFKRKWFNPLYFVLLAVLADDRIDTVLVYGGKGASKTASICQLLFREALLHKQNSILFRKESTTIPTTLKKSCALAVKTMRLENGFRQLDRRYPCISGSEIVLKGLDSPDKAKGVEGYKYVYLDELDHFTADDLEAFQISLRGIPGQKLFGSWNPVSEKSWVKTSLVDNQDENGVAQNVWIDTDKYGKLPSPDSFIRVSEDGTMLLIRTTYLDNYWIAGSPCGTYGYRDEALIRRYQKLKTKNYNSYRVNVLGEWGKTRTGSDFWKQFDEEVNVKPVAYKPAPIHLTIDDNVNPYIPVSLWQVFGKSIQQFGEIAAKDPNNNAPKAARLVLKYLDSIGHKDKIFLYGDTTARKRSTVDENSKSFFQKFIEEIEKGGYRVTSRVGKGNPRVSLSADFVNEIYEGSNTEGWQITIGDNNNTSIDDYASVKEDAEGGMAKPIVKDPVTKISYQPHGHFSDAKRYFIIQLLAAEFQRWASSKRGSRVNNFGALR